VSSFTDHDIFHPKAHRGRPPHHSTPKQTERCKRYLLMILVVLLNESSAFNLLSSTYLLQFLYAVEEACVACGRDLAPKIQY
jgi:hypothetical protein